MSFAAALDTPALPPVARAALHIGASDLPFVDLGDGSHLQLLQVDLATGLWVVRMRFTPGCTLVRHRHTGQVFAVTLQGCWYYLETPGEKNTAGSFLFEPAGSVHTLHVPPEQDEDTIVWFAVFGANENLAEDDSVEMVIDAQTVLDGYRGFCEAAGQASDKVIIGS